MKYKLVAYVDSSSTQALSLKRGVGRMKHLDTRLLWLQDLVREKKLIVEKIPTLVNPADLLTKHMACQRYQALMQLMGMVVEADEVEREAA
eukprot:11066189-Heterocapsa_arctica.AAC.1